MITRLKNHSQANCYVEILEDGVRLISYTTPVCEIRSEVLVVFGLYSMTTRKHIGYFLKEFAPYLNYQIAKKCYEEGLCYGFGIEGAGYAPLPHKNQ